MNNTPAVPLAGAAFAAPALLPTIATIVPPLLLGAGIAAALVWLLRDDEPSKTATATPGNAPPEPEAKGTPKAPLTFWDMFADNAPPAPSLKEAPTGPFGFMYPAAPSTTPALTEAECRERIRANEAKLAESRSLAEDLNRQILRSEKRIASIQSQLEAERQRRERLQAETDSESQEATPAPAIASAPISAPAPAPAVPAPAPPHSPAVVMATAEPVPGVVKPTPGKFQLFAPKVTREDLAAIFENGALRLSRQSAVKLLVGRGIKKSTAYNALRDGGRFAALLAVGEDGLLAFKA